MLAVSPSLAMLQLMLVLLLGVALEQWLDAGLAQRLRGRPVLLWSWDHIGAPLLHASVMVGAVLFAFPALFGLRAAPPLAELMPADSARFGTLLGAAFLAHLCAPLVPLLKSRVGLLSAAQGLITVSFLFVWLAGYLGAGGASCWPGVAGAAALLGLSMIAPALAAALGADLGARCDRRFKTRGLSRLLGSAMEMLGLAPILTLYGYLLGLQLGI